LWVRDNDMLTEAAQPRSEECQLGSDRLGDEKSIKVVVVDDHEVVRAGLSAALGVDPNIDVVGAAGDGASAVDIVRTARPDIVIVDYRLPDRTGSQLCNDLQREAVPPSVILFTTYLSEDVVRSAIDAGAVGCVSKSAGLAELKREIERVASGAPAAAALSTSRLPTPRVQTTQSGAEGTTPQQLAVLKLAARGLTDRQIGRKLFVSESTIRFHIQNLKRRFGAQNKVELIARAVRGGFVDGEDDDSVNLVHGQW
jgi:DNA-binding NarL/FixJ family response regulator